MIAVVGGAAGAGMAVMILAFTDYCPPEHCNADRAATSVMVSIAVAAGCVVLGCVATTVALIRRRLGWPYAVATLVLAATAEVIGIVGYFAAVGY